MELDNKVAFVTGPASAIGRAITLALARDGAHVVLAGRDMIAASRVGNEVRGLGRRAFCVVCDVTKPAHVEAAVKGALAEFDGVIDILVNVAGGAGPLETEAWKIAPEAFAEIVEPNLMGCFLTMRAVLPEMIRRRHGKIVNIAGTFGMRGRALRSAYSAAKWAMRGLTKSVALEVGPHNINVNCVCPGMVEGPRFLRVSAERAKRLGITAEAMREQFASEYALKRVSTPEDVANAVLFLASERSRQITGQDLAVDGGWVI